jgi:hypothetical protein
MGISGIISTGTLVSTIGSFGTMSSTLMLGTNARVSGIISTGTLVATSITGANTLVSTLGSFGTMSSTLILGTNANISILSTGTLVATSITGANTLVSTLGSFGTMSSTLILGTNASVSGIISTGTLVATSITGANVGITGIISTGTLVSTIGSFGTMSSTLILGTNARVSGIISTGTLVATSITGANTLVSTLGSFGTMSSTLILGTNASVSGIISTGTLVATSITGANISISGVISTGTLVSTVGSFGTVSSTLINSTFLCNNTVPTSLLVEDVSLASSIGTGSIINSLSTVTLENSGLGTGTSGFSTPNGNKYIRFNGTGTRYIETKALNLTNAISISVYGIVGNNSNGGEPPDTTGEQIDVQYSTDNITYSTVGTLIPITGSTTWSTFSLTLPTAAKGSSIYLRIIQLSNSGSALDNYGIQSITLTYINNPGIYGVNMSLSGNITSNTLLITNTTNATGVGTGGSLTVLGGVSIGKDVYVGGTLTSSSDIRLKTNIVSLKNENEKMLDKISNIRGVKFNYKYATSEDKHIGFIAQDFIENFPEILRIPDMDGYYTLDYQKVNVILLECIKELREEIIELKNKLG